VGATYGDRVEAGRALAAQLTHLKNERCVVLGIPRGGIPVAYEVARSLGSPLDVVVVRKLGVPAQPELAFGAVGPEDVSVLNDDVILSCGLTEADVDRVTRRESKERARREAMFRGGRAPVDVAGRTAIIVDDGLATGATALAAVRAVRRQGPARLVLAAPVGAPDTIARFEREVDEVVCPLRPDDMGAIGMWYRHFGPTPDEEVIDLLRRASGPAAPRSGPDERPVFVTAGPVVLEGTLSIPEGARGIVIFAHGSGSSRLSPRNRWVAQRLREAGLATLLIDLLTPSEGAEDDETARLRFDIPLLAQRVRGASEWLRHEGSTQGLPIGYFGSSTGAAAALVAAAEHPEGVRGVVSRGGRPDLAGDALDHVDVATLLIVGGHDRQVITMNEEAIDRLRCEKELRIVPGATHLFEEPGTLEKVAEHAADWFIHHLPEPTRPPHRRVPSAR